MSGKFNDTTFHLWTNYQILDKLKILRKLVIGPLFKTATDIFIIYLSWVIDNINPSSTVNRQNKKLYWLLGAYVANKNINFPLLSQKFLL